MAILTSSPTPLRIALIALATIGVSACSGMRSADKTPARGSYFTAPVFLGDSLSAFAERYGVQTGELVALNKIKNPNRRLSWGQLRVPAYGTLRAEGPALAVKPAVMTPLAVERPVTPQVAALQARPASIETRSLAPLPATSARFASVTTNEPGEHKSAPAAPAVMASLPPRTPAAEESWYDWFVPPTPSDEPAVNSGHRFLWPLEGHVISPFGDNPDGGRNDGINILAARGTPVHAAESGEVSYVGNELKSYGNLILIRHDNGFVTAYAHTDNVQVKRGERVERGQIIASAGDTGDVSQPQLHFELRHGTRPVDPTPNLVAPAPAPAPMPNSTERLAEGTR